jgi:hypothetical protein
MKNSIILFVTILIFLTVFSGISLAQTYLYNSLLGTGMTMADWQLEYIQPLEPGELEKGEYRFSPIIARVNFAAERNVFESTLDPYDYDNSSMVYAAVFDTALSDNLTLHGKYIYQPWEKSDYDSYMNPQESRMNLLDLFVNYNISEDKKLYFGYNRMLDKEKDYNSDGELDYEDEDVSNFYYIGYEMRGKFTGSSD